MTFVAVMTMKARVLYQGMFFFNSTLLYSFAIRSVGSHDLLFFSAVLAALSLVANLAVQLSASQFIGGILVLKIASITLLTWVCLRTGITPPVIALVLGIAAILATHRDALVGAPGRWSVVAASVPIAITTIWTVLAWGLGVSINGHVILQLLILPYLLTALVSIRRAPVDCSASGANERLRAWTLIASQLLPTASSFVMLTLLSYEKNTTAIADFVMMERATSIGGSLVYFYARTKGSVQPITRAIGRGFLFVLVTVFAFSVFEVSGPFGAMVYLASGCLLSYGTISLGAQYSRAILAINSIALFSVVFASLSMLKLHPINVLAFYICPQLLLMSGLVIIAARNHA